MKSRGARYERELARLLWEAGWAVARSGGSGGGRRGWLAPDILAVRAGVVLVIEVKYTADGGPVYLERGRVEALREIARRAGGRALVAVRRGRAGWTLHPLPDCPPGARYCRADTQPPIDPAELGLPSPQGGP